MRLKDKQTGEVGDYTVVNRVGEHCVGVAKDGDIDNPIFFDSLAELNERFEDAPEEKKYGGRVPKDGDEYWVVYANGVIESQLWRDTETDGDVFECGSAFWTEEEAERELARRKAYVILKEDTKGSNPDWKDLSKRKYSVCYDYSLRRLAVANFVCSTVSELAFATEEVAIASIKAHEKEWKTWLGVEG